MKEQEKDSNAEIKIQKEQVFNRTPELILQDSCGIGNGIIPIDSIKRSSKILEEKITFLIPASGSGSRMHGFLNKYLLNQDSNPDVDQYFEELEMFAWFRALDEQEQVKIKAMDRESAITYILNEQGLNFNYALKGLIPFHWDRNMALNGFQEHARQAGSVLDQNVQLHFTIQEKYLDQVRRSLSDLYFQGINSIDFSFQAPETDAYCFDESGEVVRKDGVPLRRPAGHGALLNNLNSIDSEILVIKNIDNIQHPKKDAAAIHTWQQLIGLLPPFMDELKEIAASGSLEMFKQFCSKYELVHNSRLSELSEDHMNRALNRPTRICGMVKNTGEPGGGPYWIDDDCISSKQIVEKVQIGESQDQMNIMNSSTHFNPVLIVAYKKNARGERLDLSNFRDPSKYLKVSKDEFGQTIHYRELPGLWNGGMHDWNTLFVEVPGDSFTPVKSALDLLKEGHQP